MIWSDVYGVATLTAFRLAVKSHHAPTIKYALILLLSWIVDNLAVSYYGFAEAPRALWIVNAILGGFVALVAAPARAFPGAALFTLFCIEATLWGVAFWRGFAGDRLCYTTVNIIFALEVLLVGIAGVAQGLAHGRARLDTRGDLAFEHRRRLVAGAPEWKKNRG